MTKLENHLEAARNGALDDIHRELFCGGVRMLLAVDELRLAIHVQADVETLHRLALMLESTVSSVFQTENRFMKIWDYPHRGLHARAHDQFKAELLSAVRALNAGDAEAVCESLVNEWEEWVSAHTDTHDSRLREHFDAMVIPAKPTAMLEAKSENAL